MTGTLAIPDVGAAGDTARLDAAVAGAAAAAESWTRTSIRERVALLDATRAATARQAHRWVAVACATKGIPTSAPIAGEEWMSGPVLTLRTLRLLARTLRAVETTGGVGLPRPAYARPDGQVVVPVHPTDRYDALLYPGTTAEVRLSGAVTLTEAASTMAATYALDHVRTPRVAVVLGAGNITSIGPTDALSKLFAEDATVVLKVNPVLGALLPVYGDAFRPLVDAGLLQLVGGGAAAGAHLVAHPDVTSVHVTGSDKTFDAIVFGAGEAGRRRKVQRRPLRSTPVTAELGNVTPVLVVPGPWSATDVTAAGENVATMLAHNAGFNCIAARVLVTAAGWPQRQALLDAVRATLRRTPPRPAYYPGATERFGAFVDAYPRAERLSAPVDGTLPWTLIPAVAPGEDQLCFNTEAFCGVLAETTLNVRDPVAFLDAAVGLCADRLWGSLAVTILVHPTSLRDRATAAAVERAIDRLRYGTVLVNHWAGLAFALGSTPWGAYPGHPVNDIGSGVGVVHNTFLLGRTEKSVVRGPFRSWPRPAWFVTNRQAHVIGARLAAFEAAPSPLRLPGVLAAAARG